MKAYELKPIQSLDSLTLTERPDPRPGPGQVLLDMRAWSLNYRDLSVARGAYAGPPPAGRIPLSDGVGVVREAGAGVTRVKPGDRVAGIFMQGWLGGGITAEVATSALGGAIDGMLAEQVALSEQGVVKVPAHLSDEQAATLPCAAVTAWNALVREGRIKPGDTVVCLGTGGVSLFALQFAKLAGAHVTVISSSDEKIARAKALGADAAINYRTTPEWAKATREITDGRGYDHVLELGGEKTLPQSLLCVRAGGTISIIGVLSGGTMTAQLGRIVMKQCRMVGIGVGNRDGFEAMLRAMALHQVQPMVDRVFAFEELKQAMAHLKSGAHFGKVCIRHGDKA